VLVSDFHYRLPEELIAQKPLADRAASRLLRLERSNDGLSERLEDRQFWEFPELLRPDDLVVFNNTRVFPARLYGRRGGLKAQPVSERNPAAHEFLHGRIEVLLTRQVSEEPNEWECLVRPGRKIGVGERLFFGEHDELQAEVIARGEFGERWIRFDAGAPGSAPPDPFDSPSQSSGSLRAGARGRLSLHDFFELLEEIGHVPLPPYISREDSSGDRERYQTVYARERGSVAAPTAGLHFTPEILGRMKERGIETAQVTLHVGLGTFQPVRAKKVEEHKLHFEAYVISADAAEKIQRARRESRRIVAVGTTTVRTLEYAAKEGAGEIRAGGGEANLFIYPGYEFRAVGALLTNFHLPQSTLLMLVCALGGKENVMRAYEHAVAERYRFYSYGDCMFVE
jgi:S-adenosylmethionine:tRNA ribosyltransferase-isomerase